MATSPDAKVIDRESLKTNLEARYLASSTIPSLLETEIKQREIFCRLVILISFKNISKFPSVLQFVILGLQGRGSQEFRFPKTNS